MPSDRRKWTDEERAVALGMLDEGRKVSEVVKATGVPERTLHFWRKRRDEKAGKNADEVVVEGLLPADLSTSAGDVWEKVINAQVDNEYKVEKRYNQVITIPGDQPVLFALFSDLHIGDPYADYRQMKADAELVRDTEGAYALSTGDHHNNWIGKLEGLQRGHGIDFDSELVLVRNWFEILGEKLLVVVAGNHDAWTKKLAGVDLTKEMLRGAKLLYDRDEVLFSMKVHDREVRFKCRHKWKGNSIFNPTHGEERIERSDTDYDVGIGGHTHIGTLFREFFFHGTRRVACLVGTYKFYDRFGVRHGFSRSVGSGCGALLFLPDGTMQPWSNLRQAVEYLRWLRGEKK
jgi:transposase-like protein